MLRKDVIRRTAVCYWSADDACYVVESPFFPPVVAAEESPEEARRLFESMLDSAYDELLVVVFYKESNGCIPALDFLDAAPEVVQLKLVARLQLLGERGHELRRPHCDYLRDSIYELRVRHVRSHYRLLYFFHGQRAVVISHGLTKEGQVSPRDIERAIGRREEFLHDPAIHSFSRVSEDEQV